MGLINQVIIVATSSKIRMIMPQTLLLLMLSEHICQAAYPPNLLMKDDCLFSYLGEGVGSYLVTFPDGSETQKNNLSDLVYDSTNNCTKNDIPGHLVMSFKPDNNFGSIKLEFTIKQISKDFWAVTSTVLKIDALNPHLNPDKEVQMKPANGAIWANSYQSYSCSALVLENLASSKASPYYKIMLERFQLQPFLNPDGRNIFASSHDCYTWITLPQIMGLLLIIFIIFTSMVGIYLLLDLGNNTSNLKYSKQGGMLMNQAQLDATNVD